MMRLMVYEGGMGLDGGWEIDYAVFVYLFGNETME